LVDQPVVCCHWDYPGDCLIESVEMKTWHQKRAVIVGAARQGIALARYLVQHGASVVLTDTRPADRLEKAFESLDGLPVEWVLEEHPFSLLDGTDVVCPSGGVSLEIPLVVEARNRGIRLSNDSQIFLEVAPCTVIGVTGSAGKTTTTTLVGRMANALEGRKTWVGGNIGNPLIEVVDQMKSDDLVVMELSSFQLDIMTVSPQIGAVLNITPNHLDRHGTMDAYVAAKANLLKYQIANSAAILGHDDPAAWNLRSLVRGKLFSFGWNEPPEGGQGAFLKNDEIVFRSRSGETALMNRADNLLRGDHNLLNVLAASAVVCAAGLPTGLVRKGVEGFMGVPHRLEFVRNWRGADWYNDSIATAPERAIAGIRAFDQPLVLLAGGRDKNLPWDDFANLVCQRVKHLITFGETAGMIAQKVQGASCPSRPATVVCCSNLEDALQKAADLVSPADVVLLSPGGTSFDEFEDFAERGNRFKQWVLQQT